MGNVLVNTCRQISFKNVFLMPTGQNYNKEIMKRQIRHKLSNNPWMVFKLWVESLLFHYCSKYKICFAHGKYKKKKHILLIEMKKKKKKSRHEILKIFQTKQVWSVTFLLSQIWFPCSNLFYVFSHNLFHILCFQMLIYILLYIFVKFFLLKCLYFRLSYKNWIVFNLHFYWSAWNWAATL